jgi:hypothetical protein
LEKAFVATDGGNHTTVDQRDEVNANTQHERGAQKVY